MTHVRMACRTDALGIARVHERTWKEAYRGILDSGYLDALSAQKLLGAWRRNLERGTHDLDEKIYVASAARSVVGFVMVGASRESFAPWEAEISMIYLLKEYRAGGIGRSLMKAAADHCLRRGMFSVGLWVLRENAGARNFYGALKGEQAGQKFDSVGGQIVPLTGYCWQDVAVLAERSAPVISYDSP